MAKESNKKNTIADGISLLNRLLETPSVMELKYTKKGALKNPKRETSDERISPISDAMFKLMFENDENKEYTCKLISALIGLDYNYLLENMVFYKNDINRRKIKDSQRRGDLIIKLKDSYVAVEMNNVSRVGRNFEYATKISGVETRRNEDVFFFPIVEINVNNYSYSEIKDSINFYTFLNLLPSRQEHVLIKVFYVEIYLPLICEKCYTELNEAEKIILAMFETSKERAEVLTEGDEVLMKYMETIDRAQSNEDFLEAYDHELANFECGRDEGYYAGLEEGREAGLKDGHAVGLKEGRITGLEEGRAAGLEEGLAVGLAEGVLKEREKTIKNMLNRGLTSPLIAEYLNIDIEEVNRIASSLSNKN